MYSYIVSIFLNLSYTTNGFKITTHIMLHSKLCNNLIVLSSYQSKPKLSTK